VGECNGTTKKKSITFFSANFAPRLRFVSRLRRPNLSFRTLFFHRFMIEARRIKQEFFFCPHNPDKRNQPRSSPGIQWEPLFTSEQQHDDGVLKISRRKSLGCTTRFKARKRTGGCLWERDATRPLTKQILTSCLTVECLYIRLINFPVFIRYSLNKNILFKRYFIYRVLLSLYKSKNIKNIIHVYMYMCVCVCIRVHLIHSSLVIQKLITNNPTQFIQNYIQKLYCSNIVDNNVV